MAPYELVKQMGVTDYCIVYIHEGKHGKLQICKYRDSEEPGGIFLEKRLNKSLKKQTPRTGEIKDLIKNSKASGNSIFKEFANESEFDSLVEITLDKLKDDYDNFIEESRKFAEEQAAKEALEEELKEIERVAQEIEEGKTLFENLGKPLSEYLIEIFEKLMPGDGLIGAILWASGLATVKGEPQITVLKGNPGEGKTVLMKYILKAIPDEHIIRMNVATEASLFNNAGTKGIDYLDKKIVYLGDLGDKNGFKSTLGMRKILRELQSDGYFCRDKNEKIKNIDGVVEWEPVFQELKGRPGMWFTTVREDMDHQEEDRSIIATTNLKYSKEIKYIMMHIGKDNKTGRMIQSIIDNELKDLKKIFRYLIQCDIKPIIPWPIHKLDQYKFRDLDRLISLSGILTMLDYPYRETYREFHLVGDDDLFRIAKFMYEGSGDLSDLVMKRLHALFEIYGYNWFTRSDAVALFSDSYSQNNNLARDILTPAVKAGILEEDKDERNRYIYTFEKDWKKDDFKFKVPEIDWEMIEREYGD